MVSLTEPIIFNLIIELKLLIMVGFPTIARVLAANLLASSVKIAPNATESPLATADSKAAFYAAIFFFTASRSKVSASVIFLT